MALGTCAGTMFLVVLCSALAVFGLLATRRIVDITKLRSDPEVGGSMLQVIGTLYAVLLGLVVVNAMQKFEQARQITETEANALAEVFILASKLPDCPKHRLQDLCSCYAKEVVEEEWKLMREGKYSPDARRQAVQLMQASLDFEPITDNQKAIYPILVNEAMQVWDNRRIRINIADFATPVVEWVALIAGGILTIFFTYLLDLKNFRLQIAMTALVAALIVFNLDLLVLYDCPFSGDLFIHPNSFTVDQGIFENRITSTRRILR